MPSVNRARTRARQTHTSTVAMPPARASAAVLAALTASTVRVCASTMDGASMRSTAPMAMANGSSRCEGLTKTSLDAQMPNTLTKRLLHSLPSLVPASGSFSRYREAARHDDRITPACNRSRPWHHMRAHAPLDRLIHSHARKTQFTRFPCLHFLITRHVVHHGGGVCKVGAQQVALGGVQNVNLQYDQRLPRPRCVDSD